MLTATSTSPKVIPIHLLLVTGLIIILAIAVITGFVWAKTDHVIAPAGLKLMEQLWTLFICRCPPV